MDLHDAIAQGGSAFASVLVVASYTMKTMIPLRIFAIVTNLVLIGASYFSGIYATMVLHMVMLPINCFRLHEMMMLVKNVRSAMTSDLSMEWLKPFMTREDVKAGDVLFYKGDIADEMMYVVSGRFRLVESGIELAPGSIVGELGMLSPSNQRTQSLECLENGVILKVTYRQVEELYVQNPAFGFYFLRLATARLFENIGRLESQLAQRGKA